MLKKIIIAVMGLTLLSGCGTISIKNNSTRQPVLPNYGVFKTSNKGDLWQQKGALYSIDGTRKTISYGQPAFFKFDPQDANTLYVGTDNGIFYSFSRGEGWFQTLQGKGIVNDIAIDPRDKCTLYAAVHDKVYKSI